MDDLEKELKVCFLEEAIQLLDDTEQAFLDLESSDDPSLVDRIFRLAHNIKGTSRAVGFGDVAEFTHELENMLLAMKEGHIGIDGDVVTLMLKCNDHLRSLIEALNEDIEATFDSSRIIQQIQQMMSAKMSGVQEKPVEKNEDAEKEIAELLGESQPEEENDVFAKADSSAFDEDGNFEIDPNAISKLEDFEDKQKQAVEADQFAEEAAKLEATIDEKDKAVEEVVVDEEDDDDEQHQELLLKEVMQEANSNKGDGNGESGSSGTGKKRQIEETIRVKLKELEKLNNYVGELVILQTVLNQNSNLIESEFLQKTISQLEKLSKEIQTISMGLRMVPIKQTFQKMQRIVRDTSRALGKKVKLEINGETTEVDKTVLEHLGDPLVHIVRNAVDHGLEATPQERVVAGKSETGTVELQAFHEGNNLVIEIKDDGQGINPEFIRQKAIEKGLISKNQVLSDDEIINMIFAPSFSTKQEVSEISGRGVGMDVVKTNIRSLNGDVKVSTRVGEGSVFRVVLPLTLAIIDGMIVQVGKSNYVFPITQIHETIQPKKENITYVTGMGHMLTLRGEVMPIYKLGDTLGVRHQLENLWDGIVVIVRQNGSSYAVFVDEISRLQQVVIKKLGEEISKKKGMIGSAILGDGMPSIIIDLNELYAADSIKISKRKINNTIGAA